MANRLLTAIFVSDLGRNLSIIPLTLHIYQLTESSLFSSLFFLSSKIPKLLFATKLGTFLDRTSYSASQIHSYSQLFCCFTMFIMSLESSFSNPLAIIVLFFIANIGCALNDISKSTTVKRLYDEKPHKLVLMNTRINMLPNLAMGVASILGFFFYNQINIKAFLIADSATYLFASILLRQDKTERCLKDQGKTKNDAFLPVVKNILSKSKLRNLVIEKLFYIACFSCHPLLVGIYSTQIEHTIKYNYHAYVLGASIASLIVILSKNTVLKFLNNKTMRISFFSISYVLQSTLLISWQLPQSLFLLTTFLTSFMQCLCFFYILMWISGEILQLIKATEIGSFSGAMLSIDLGILTLTSLSYGFLSEYLTTLKTSVLTTSSVFLLFLIHSFVQHRGNKI